MLGPRRMFLIAGFATLVVGAAGAHALGANGPLAARYAMRQQAFVAALDLNDAQQKSLMQLRGRELAFRDAARADVAALASQVKAELADPRADLRATVRQVQADVDRLIAEHRDVTAAKLAFYDQLDSQQQAKVRAQLVAKIERLERVRDALLDLAEATQ